MLKMSCQLFQTNRRKQCCHDEYEHEKAKGTVLPDETPDRVSRPAVLVC